MKIGQVFGFLVILQISAGSILSDTLHESLMPHTGKVIRKIEIIRKNVFDDETLGNGPFYYHWANSLHIVTKEKVIEKELLFEVGDTLDIQKVIETERNLRRGQFIGEIGIAAIGDSAGGVDLTVTTTDLWTTKASSNLDLAGGNYSFGLGLTEENALGLGKMIDLSGQIGNDQDGAELTYSDSRLFGSRLGLLTAYYHYTYNKTALLKLTRPQYSLSVPFGFKSSFTVLDTRPRLFYQGEEYFRYKSRRTLFGVEGVYSLGHENRFDIIAGYDYDGNDYSTEIPNSPYNHIIPENEIFSYPGAGIGGRIIRYDLERFLDGAGTPEDLTMGVAVRINRGYSEKEFGADYAGAYQAIATQYLLKPKEDIFIGGLNKVTWWRHNNRNERIRYLNEAVIYIRPLPMHLFVLHARTDFAWRQLPTYQVLLGGGNGLRGHSYYELAGDKLALGNAEYRFYTPIRILTARLGGAIFFDIGNVWQAEEPIKFSQLKSDVGVGFRFGLTKSSTSRVINFDIARSLTDNSYYITFGTTAPFSLNFINIGD